MRPLSLLGLLLLASAASAQADRYELGARLKVFEAEWDKQTDPAARKRATKVLPDVTGQFFSFQLGKAGQTLDTARFALLSDTPPSDAVLWATSLYPEVKTRLVSGKEVEVSVKQFYTVKAERPKGVSVRLGFDGNTWTDADVAKLPAKVSVPIPGTVKRPADLMLTMEVIQDGKPLAARAVGVSVFDGKPWERVEKPKLGGTRPVLELPSLLDRYALLDSLAGGTVPESEIPAAKVYADTGRLTDSFSALGKDFFTPDNPGDHWLTVPTGDKGKTLTPCRLFVPEKLDAKKPVPLVLALHGAGGSENLFFEGYGNGHVVKLCKDRGWLLLSPRCGLGFGLTPAPPFADILDELAKRYPIDPKRVFVVGHSMGSSLAIDAVGKSPGRYAAVACLGGGGSVRKAEAFDGLPVFVGVGDKDFALKTAKGLHTALEKTKAKPEFKEYPDVEHLLIVREALGDVFERWDKIK